MSDERIADFRDTHFPIEELGQTFCAEDSQHWPCDSGYVLDALTAAQATIAQRDDRLRVAQSEMRAHAGRADQLYADLMRSGKKVSALTDELIAATDRGNAWQTVAADLTERLCQESERLAARDAQVDALTTENTRLNRSVEAWSNDALMRAQNTAFAQEQLAARDAQVAELTAALDVVYRCARDRGNEMGGDRPTYELAFEAACIGAGALKFIEAHAQELLARTPAAPEGEAVAEEKSGTKEDRS